MSAISLFNSSFPRLIQTISNEISVGFITDILEARPIVAGCISLSLSLDSVRKPGIWS